MKKTIAFLFMLFLIRFSNGQLQPVDVIDETLKLSGLNGEQVLYYGFEAGEKIVFNFSEVDKKELKQIEIAEYPSNIKFADYKTKEIQNKIINVISKGVYVFRFQNTALGGRICKVKIQRIPASEATKNFNTDVVWKNYNDTTYKEETERYLIKSDTVIDNSICSPDIVVHSSSNANGNHESFNFTLPRNTVKWGYYVGVDQEGKQAFEKASRQTANDAARLPGYGPLAAFVLYGAACFSTLQSKESVNYALVEGEQNRNQFYHDQAYNAYKSGNVACDPEKMTFIPQGNLYFCFRNTNLITAITVTLRIMAVTVNQEWGTRQVKKMNIVTKNLPFNAN